MARRLSARTVRQAHTFPVTLGLGEVTVRRLDLMNQWLLGKVDHALVEEVYASERIFATFDRTVSTMEALEALTPEERQTLLLGLRRFATIAIVEPRVTWTDDGDPDAVPVALLDFPDLMAIWNAKPPADVTVDPDQPLAVPAAEGGAARFPESAPAPESSEPARDHAERAGGARPTVALSTERPPYRGLVSLTTH